MEVGVAHELSEIRIAEYKQSVQKLEINGLTFATSAMEQKGNATLSDVNDNLEKPSEQGNEQKLVSSCLHRELLIKIEFAIRIRICIFTPFCLNI